MNEDEIEIRRRLHWPDRFPMLKTLSKEDRDNLLCSYNGGFDLVVQYEMTVLALEQEIEKLKAKL